MLLFLEEFRFLAFCPALFRLFAPLKLAPTPRNEHGLAKLTITTNTIISVFQIEIDSNCLHKNMNVKK
jgi:hypothetical protein